MKIGFLLGAPQIGGMERQNAILASRLHQMGHYVVVFFLCSKNFVSDCKIDFGNIEQHFLNLSRLNQLWKHLMLRKLLVSKDIQILQAYNFDAIRLGVRATKRKCSSRCVGTIMGTRFASDSRMARRLRNVLQFTDLVTVETNVVKKLLVDRGIYDSQKIFVIPNAIEVPEKTIKSTNNKRHVLFAGTLKKVKDPECFVKAAIRLIKKGYNFQFTIAGGGPLAETLKNMVKKTHCEGRIKFLGKLPPDQVPYSAADLVVSTSLREASSNTILEALAHGLPVVATNVGGSSEIIKRGNCGLLIEPQDVQALERAITILLENEEYLKLGRNGRQFVIENYSISQNVQLHLELYTKLINKTPAL